MTPRERILAAIHHKPVDKLPTDMWGTQEIMDKLLDHFRIEDKKSQSKPSIFLGGGVLTTSPEAIIALFDKLDISQSSGTADRVSFVTPVADGLMSVPDGLTGDDRPDRHPPGQAFR